MLPLPSGVSSFHFLAGQWVARYVGESDDVWRMRVRWFENAVHDPRPESTP